MLIIVNFYLFYKILLFYERTGPRDDEDTGLEVNK